MLLISKVLKLFVLIIGIIITHVSIYVFIFSVYLISGCICYFIVVSDLIAQQQQPKMFNFFLTKTRFCL